MSKYGAKLPRRFTWKWTKNRYLWCISLRTYLPWNLWYFENIFLYCTFIAVIMYILYLYQNSFKNHWYIILPSFHRKKKNIHVTFSVLEITRNNPKYHDTEFYTIGYLNATYAKWQLKKKGQKTRFSSIYTSFKKASQLKR